MTEPKRGLKDRVLDRVPVFGRVRRTKGWLRRNKGWVYFALALVVLFIVGPVLRIVATAFSILRGPISALLDNPVGRFFFYNALALLLFWLVWRKVRRGIWRVVGLRAMRSFLDGMNQMILGRWRGALPHFERVAMGWRRVRLEDAVPEHRDIRADAFIKIATCHLRLGNPNEAKNWILRVRESDILTDHVRRNRAELLALSYDANDELEPETIVSELEKSRTKDRRNRRVLLALRDRLEAAGELDRAREVGKKLVAVSEGPAREQAEGDLGLLEFRLAHKALGSGDKRGARKALRARTGDVRAALLLGDVALENDDLKGALKAWSRAVSLPVFERVDSLLAAGNLGDERGRELLLKYLPYAGTMIVLAEHYRRNKEYRKARAAVEQVVALGGENVTVLRLWAECLRGEGDDEQAEQLYRRALSLSFGG